MGHCRSLWPRAFSVKPPWEEMGGCVVTSARALHTASCAPGRGGRRCGQRWAGVGQGQYLIFNVLIVVKKLLEDHRGVPGVVLAVDAAAAFLRLPVLGHCQGVPAGEEKRGGHLLPAARGGPGAPGALHPVPERTEMPPRHTPRDRNLTDKHRQTQARRRAPASHLAQVMARSSCQPRGSTGSAVEWICRR